MSETEREVRRARRFGWASLGVWVAVGLTLEAMHGFKVSAYLDDEMTRLLLTLGHAHGVGLSLVVLVYSSAGVPLLSERPDGGRGVGRLLRAAAVSIPVGFALGAIGHSESDPSLAVLLVPIGGALLLTALIVLARAAFR